MASVLAFARDVVIQGALVVAAGYLTFKKIMKAVNRFFSPEENPEESAAKDIMFFAMLMYAFAYASWFDWGVSWTLITSKFTIISQYSTDIITLLVAMILTSNIIVGLAFHILEWRGRLTADIVDKITARGTLYYVPVILLSLAAAILLGAGNVRNSPWLLEVAIYTCLGGWPVAAIMLIIDVVDIATKAANHYS